MTAAAPTGSRLQGTAARRRNEGAVKAVLLGAAFVTVLISVGIVLSLIFQAFAPLRPVPSYICPLSMTRPWV